MRRTQSIERRSVDINLEMVYGLIVHVTLSYDIYEKFRREFFFVPISKSLFASRNQSRNVLKTATFILFLPEADTAFHHLIIYTPCFAFSPQ